MAVRVAERSEVESRRRPSVTWIALLLLAAVGAGWAVLAGADAVTAGRTPIGDEATPLIWVWVVYAAVCSVLLAVLALLRLRAILGASLLGVVATVGVVLVVGVAGSVPGRLDLRTGHEEPAWEPVLTHTGLGSLSLVGLVVAAYLVTRHTAPLGSIAILAVGLCAAAVTMTEFDMSDVIMIANGAPDWSGVPDHGRSIADGKFLVDLALVAGYLTATVAGVVRAVRRRDTKAIILFVLCLPAGLIAYGVATGLLDVFLFVLTGSVL